MDPQSQFSEARKKYLDSLAFKLWIGDIRNLSSYSQIDINRALELLKECGLKPQTEIWGVTKHD